MNLDIVLFEPEIPQNTGNIARTCVAIGARLHLVGHLGFSLADRYLKRAGLDYWFDLDLTLWDSLDDFWDGWHRQTTIADQTATAGNQTATAGNQTAAGSNQTAAGSNQTAAAGYPTAADAEDGIFYATTKASVRFTDVAFPERTVLVFGPESRGLPQPLLEARPERCIRIPMRDGNRSLNLANSVAVVAYEALRQNGFPGLR